MAENNSITFSVLGGGGEVGASCFELGIGGRRLLIDCGTHPKKDGAEALPSFELLRRAPDALLLSHGHVDHCGSIPYLIRQFPSVRVHCTYPTARIIDRMLHNSVSVMTAMSRERGIADYPLFEHEDVNYAMQGVKGHEMDAPFLVSREPEVRVTFLRAGHVLGAASILIESPGHNVLYTGDICQRKQELMPGMKKLDADVRIDTLIIEATHGATEDSHHPDYDEEAYRLAQEVAKVLNAGGVAMLPSFALGRMQEILNVVARMQEQRIIPEVPVYASGLGRAIYEIYDRYHEYLRPDADLRPLNLFGRVGNVWEDATIDDLLAEPCIIVATSGMMLENTPSALIAERMVREEQHGIFFVGYLDHETLGYRLLHGGPGNALNFRLGGPRVPVTLRNIQRFYFTAHAPRPVLQQVVERHKPKNVIYVHGDRPALDWMLANTAHPGTAYAPGIGELITLGE